MTANSAVPQPRMKSSSTTQITNTIADSPWFTTEALPEPNDANSIKTRTIAVPIRTSPTVIGHTSPDGRVTWRRTSPTARDPSTTTKVVGGDNDRQNRKGLEHNH